MAVKKVNPGRIKTPLGEVSTVEGNYVTSKFPFAINNYNPDDLVGKKGLKVYNTVRKDAQVKAALSIKKLAVLSSGWEIFSGDETIRNFINDNFLYLDNCNFDKCLFEILTAVDFGFSVTERVLKFIEEGEWKGYFGLKYLKTRNPEYIDFEFDQYGNLFPDGIKQNNINLPTGRFIIYSYRKEFSNHYGKSDLREIYRDFFIKDQLLHYMAMSMERFGEPIFKFTPQRTLTRSQKDALFTVVERIKSRTTLILPPGVELELLQGDPRGARTFLQAIELCDKQIRVGLLLPGLMGLSAENVAGSFARAEKEFDVFIWIVSQIRKELEDLINEQLIQPLTDVNYIVTKDEYPKFRFKDIVNEEKLFELWIKAIQGNSLNKILSDENKWRELLGLEPLSEEEFKEDVTKLAVKTKPDDHGNPVSTDTGDRSIVN